MANNLQVNNNLRVSSPVWTKQDTGELNLEDDSWELQFSSVE